MALLLRGGLRLALGSRLGDDAVDLGAEGVRIERDAGVPPAREHLRLGVALVGPRVAGADHQAAGPGVGVAESLGRLGGDPQDQVVAIAPVRAGVRPLGAEVDRRAGHGASRETLVTGEFARFADTRTSEASAS
ncbi:hypothetical protein [Methylobacterium gregans]|uniref:hypothetical protein n=1 Tax=Methylobacterium gregans TaxID=374424 RepID=UPI00361160AA